jgi:Ca2+-transporting ATPase
VLGFLGIIGLVMGVSTLLVIWWAGARYGEDIARTMGLTAFSLANLFFSFTVRSEVRSVFSLDTFDDRRFVITSAMSVAAIILATEFGLFQKILHTVGLNLTQWLVCVVAAATVVVVSELRKVVLRRRDSSAPGDSVRPRAADAHVHA